jgi:sirohydrochlorin ferrochelatase
MTEGISIRRGTILVDHGSRRDESNLMLEQLAATWQVRRPEWIIEPAHMELASPSISDAFDSCVRRGATRVVISPFFLLPGRHWTSDIPSLAAAAATHHVDVPWLLAAPIGLHDLVLNVLESRIETCLAFQQGGAACEICDSPTECHWSK